MRLRGMKFKLDYPEMLSEYIRKMEYFMLFFQELKEDKLL
jgi:hypothetical protein